MNLCIYQVLANWAERTPDAPAILASGHPPLTYSRLRRHVDEVGQTLHAMGLGRHDRVVLVLPNGPEMAVACLTVTAVMTCAPLNPAYSASEFAFYLTALHPQALLIQYGMDSPARAVAHAHNIRVIELLCTPEAEAGLFTLVHAECPPKMPPEFATPDAVAFVLHTSGTTSQPKMVPLTHANVCTAAYHLCTALALHTSDRCLNILPLFHTYGLVCALLTSLTAGSSTVCLPGFDAACFFTWLEEFRPTWYQAVPAIHQEILARATQHREIIARCPLRFIRSGTAPLPPSVRAGLEHEFKIPLIEGWGMVEACGPVTCNAPLSRQRRPGSVGLAIGTEIAIIDEAGARRPAGAIGEVVIRGPIVMQGYENDATANKHAFIHGWFRSGDAGYLDTDGYLFLTGRIKEVINRGGEKIAPQEVDEVLMSHPAVAQAATFAVPHARLGEDVATAVVLRPHAVLTANDLRQFAVTRLAAFKVPSQVLVVDDIPKDPTSGKLQRLALAEKLGLPAPGWERSSNPGGTAAPRTPLEESLVELWTQVLGMDHIGIYDSFFQLGGDSILATQLISRTREVMHVEVSFRSLFETPTVAGMARHLETAGKTAAGLHVPSLHPVPRDEALPLSYAQQRLWFLEQLEPGRAAYNLSLAWRFVGVLKVSALEQSLGEVVRRHEILRTTFPSVDGQPAQVIASDLTLPLRVVDLQDFPQTTREAVAQHLLTEEARWPFDLAHGPLVRATLLRLSSGEHVLLLTLHHIIFDGWSAEVFWRELTTVYIAICTQQPVSLPALPLQYADFAVWQRQWLQGPILEAQLAYWKKQLGDTLPIIELPIDRPRPPVQTLQGTRHTRLLPLSLTTALKALSQQEGVTLFMTLAAAFQTLLCRYTGQTDLVVGTPIAGRTRAETEGLVGLFVNTLVLRSDLSGNPCFRELLGRVREVTLGAYDYQELPFENLVETLQPARDLSRNPLVQVMIALQPSLPLARELPGLTVHPVMVDAKTAKFELTLSLQDTDQGLLTTVEYNTDLFDQTTITRMLGHLHILLEGIITTPEQRLADLPLLTAAEKQQLLVEWNAATIAYPQDICLHNLFELQTERIPDNVAVVCDGQQLTYSSLNRRANQLAHYLRDLGVGPDVVVGLCVERSLEMVMGCLGILKAGGAYVPLDPAYPSERLAAMMTEARIAVLVTQQQCLTILPEHEAYIVCLDTDRGHIAQQHEANPSSGVVPESLAYVMYTSGSTGIPKGVMVEHRQVVAFLHSFEHIAPGGEGGIGTAVCPFGFDVSVWECFSMLCFGGILHLMLSEIVTAPEQFARYLVEHRITSAYIPPALLSDVVSYLEQQHEPMMINRLLVGVEPIKQGTLQRFRHLSEHMRIVNGYGPTEATVCATLFPFDEATELGRRTPIGTRVKGYDVYLVDTYGQPVPIGIPGELLIGGVGLARGYINRPALTAESFIPHPFSTIPGARLYKTGDLARYLSDGNLEFLGRHDQQVKMRGYRIELEEIEAVLRQHAAVRETVVLARQDVRRDDRYLVAYLVANQGPAPAPHALRTFLQQKLPAYMIPSAFVVLEALPRTPHGKIDRQALPMPDVIPCPGTSAFAAPGTPVERTLAGIWVEVLGLERVSVHDNFFELGGDSILSIQIIARANRAGLQLTPKHLFQHQTIAELATVANPLFHPWAEWRQELSDRLTASRPQRARLSPSAAGYTPSDFLQMQLTQQELDEIMRALGESTEGD